MSKLKLLQGAPNEIVFCRQFDAPRRLVIEAMTNPKWVKRWLGGTRAEVRSAEIDFRVGGSYRYVFRINDGRQNAGHEFTFSGTYVEVGEDRIVHTERFDDQPSEARVTLTFSESHGRTELRMVMAFESIQVRDFVESTGMAEGAGESYDVLDGVLGDL